MYAVPLQCFCTVTRSHVTALTVMACGTRTLQDTHRHSLTRLQHNASWLPEAMCHCSTELRRPSQVNTYRTDILFTVSIFLPTFADILLCHELLQKEKGQNINLYPRNVGWTPSSNAPLIIQTVTHIHTVGIKLYTVGLWPGLVEDSKIMFLNLASE